MAVNGTRLRLERLLVATFLAALSVLVVFKGALFAFAASGAEGKTSGLRMAWKFFLCLGWDVVGALVATALVTPALVAVLPRWPRLAVPVAAAFQVVHAVFVAGSHQVWRVMGAPLEKTVIDLAFFNADPSASGRWDAASSIAPYVGAALLAEVAMAVLVPLAVLRVALVPPVRLPRARVLLAAPLGALALATLVLVPILVRARVLHVYGLDGSPLTVLAGSYLRTPIRRVLAAEPPPRSPFCLDDRSPVGPARLPAAPLAAARPRRSNLLVVLLESVGKPTLDRSPAAMPFLGELSRGPGAVTFREHYTHWPQTMQSVFSLLCSELPYPEHTPITYVNPAIPCVSLPEALKAAGWQTALFTSGDLAFERQLRFYKHRRFDVIADRNELPGREGAWSNTWGIDERVTVSAILGHLDRRDPARPFFVVYNMAAGHHPYEIPGRPADFGLDAEAEAEAQRATLRFVDDRLRDLHDGLRARGLLDDTLVAVVSDHGPGSGRPGMGRARDASVYEGSVHVPFVVRGPQLTAVREDVTSPTGHVDFAPTLLALLGVEPPATMKGRDLVHDASLRAVVMGTRPPLSQIGVRAGAWKLVLSGDGAAELFDLAADPREQEDLARSRPDLVSALAAVGQRWPGHARYLVENYAEVLREAKGKRCR